MRRSILSYDTSAWTTGDFGDDPGWCNGRRLGWDELLHAHDTVFVVDVNPASGGTDASPVMTLDPNARSALTPLGRIYFGLKRLLYHGRAGRTNAVRVVVPNRRGRPGVAVLLLAAALTLCGRVPQPCARNPFGVAGRSPRPARRARPADMPRPLGTTSHGRFTAGVGSPPGIGATHLRSHAAGIDPRCARVVPRPANDARRRRPTGTRPRHRIDDVS